MKIRVFAFGKLKTPGLREAADHSKKLLKTWAELEEIELKALEAPDKSASTRREIQEREGTLLLAKFEVLRPRAAVYLLDETGKARPSEGWAELLGKARDESIPEVAFCIGSSFGFSSDVRARARGILSLGPQTLSHQLARVVLYEQLYRALSIVHGHPYHHAGS